MTNIKQFNRELAFSRTVGLVTDAVVGATGFEPSTHWSRIVGVDCLKNLIYEKLM